VSLALVTGATGLVGSHIVERLLSDGWDVRALARDPERARWELHPTVKIVHGDVLDSRAFTRAAEGAQAIFHTAASIIVSGGWDAYRVTNVDGTRNAIAAAEQTRARLLQLSSVAVYGPSARYAAAERGEKTHEQIELPALRETAYYARSKRDSEALVLSAHREGRVWATAVRPDVIYGKRDRQFVPRMALLIKRGVIPLLRGGRSTMAIVHAANVADGAVRAVRIDGAGGNAYNLANDFDVTVRDFFELAGEGLNQRPRFLPMPMWAARGALRGAKWVARAVTAGRFNLVSTSTLDFISRDNPFTSDRARRELGWAPSVRPETAIPEAFRDWRLRRETKKGAT